MRHLQVHQDQVVAAALGALHGLQPVGRRVDGSAEFREQFEGDLAVDRLVLDEQDALAALAPGFRRWQGGVRAIPGRSRFLETYREPEVAAAARCALGPGITAHHPGQTAGDGEAESGAAVQAGDGLAALLEGDEQALKVIRLDADAGIADGEAQQCAFLAAFQHAAADFDAAVFGELDRIAEVVEQRLADAGRVAEQAGRQVLGLNLQVEPARFRAFGEHVAYLLDQSSRVDLDLLQRQLAGLDLREVEDVVDDVVEVLAGIVDLLQALFLLVGLAGAAQQVNHADDRVERGPDLVADIGDERRFGEIRRFRRIAGGGEFARACVHHAFQILAVVGQLFLDPEALGDVEQAELQQRPTLVADRHQANLRRPFLAIGAAVPPVENLDALMQAGQHMPAPGAVGLFAALLDGGRHVERGPRQHLLARVRAVDAHGRLVAVEMTAALRVHHHQGRVRAREEQAVVFLAFAQRFLLVGERGFRLLAAADVEHQQPDDGGLADQRQPEDQPLAPMLFGQFLRPLLDHLLQFVLVGLHFRTRHFLAGGVVDHREEQGATVVEMHRRGIDLDRAQAAVGEPVRKDEIAAPFRPRAFALGGHLFRGQRIDVLNPQLFQLGERSTVKLAGRQVGIDNGAAGRIDEEHDRGVLPEQRGEQVVAGLGQREDHRCDQREDDSAADQQQAGQRSGGDRGGHGRRAAGTGHYRQLPAICSPRAQKKSLPGAGIWRRIRR